LRTSRHRTAIETIFLLILFVGFISVAYDAHGNVTNISSTTPDGVRLSYAYDVLNRLSAVADPHAGNTSYSYDPVGNLSGYLLPNDVLNLYAYDSLNRLTNLTARRFLNTLASYAYTVNPSGHRATATEALIRNPLNPVPYTISRLYHYDPTYRLTNETISAPQLSTPATLNYTYDAVGNRQDLLSTLAEIPSATYGYDANDHLTSDTYDANGNTLTAPGFGMAQPDRYDFENRLIERTIAGKTVTITYDGDGNRARKTVTTATNTVTTLYLVDTVNPTGYAQILEEHVSQNSSTPSLQRVYTFGLTLLAQDQLLNGAWTVRYHGLDGHGSTRYLTDAAGDITDTYDYDAFGNLIAATGNTPNNFLFTSEQLDPDLGLYFLRARYQDTTTGRFWTMDDFEGSPEDPLSLHKYLYASADAVNNSDPTGFLTLAEVKGSVTLVMRLSLRVTVNVLRAYWTASSLVDVINSVHGVVQLLSGGQLKDVIQQTVQAQRTANWKFSLNDVLTSLEMHAPQILNMGLDHWSRSLLKALQRGDRIESFLIYLPTPGPNIPQRPIPTGIVWKKMRVELMFGGPSGTQGRITGAGFRMNKTPHIHQLWRMDAGSKHRSAKPHEVAIIDDPPHFHYHVLRW
jgi:RHS repeat-associated protein